MNGSTRVTPDNIVDLAPDEIFCFGSNAQGAHAGGAAKVAHEKFGAEWGVGKGPTGQCYAIDTMNGQDDFQNNLEDFVRYAKKHSKQTFMLTKVGCGIAGYSENNVREMLDIAAYRVNRFESSKLPDNIVKPMGW